MNKWGVWNNIFWKIITQSNIIITNTDWDRMIGNLPNTNDIDWVCFLG